MMPPLISNHFPSQFFRTLQQFRDTRYLCDVRLIADGEIEFPAHRLVLAINSPFFSDLFQTRKDSQDVTTVHLRNCSAECVQILLQFLYSGELQLKDCDPGKVLSVARACRIGSLEQILSSYVTSPPSPSSPSNKLQKSISPKLSNDDPPSNSSSATSASSGASQKRKAKSSTVSSSSGSDQLQQLKKPNGNKTTQQQQQQAPSLLATSGANRQPTIPASIFMQNGPTTTICPVHGIFACTCPFVSAMSAGIANSGTDPTVAAAIQQLFFGAAAAAAAAAAAQQTTDVKNEINNEEDVTTTSCVAYGPPLPKVARVSNKNPGNGLYLGAQNGELHCQLPTTPANARLFAQRNVQQTNGQILATNGVATLKTQSITTGQQSSVSETPADTQLQQQGSLNTVQVPADDKEGWCRNKKYIKKTPQGYQCTVCKKTYGRYNSVSYHVTIYHRNPPIQCDQPGCTFSTREARYIHFHKYYRHDVALPTNIDLESRRCPFCKHVAKSPAMLEKHINRHMPDGVRVGRSYHCELCKKELSSRSALAQHLITHETEKGLSCDQCSYRGRTMENLQQHKLFKHSNAGDLWCAKHQCDECQYSTPSKMKLLEHQRNVHCKEDAVSSSIGSTVASDIFKNQLDDDDDGDSGNKLSIMSNDDGPVGGTLHSDSDEEFVADQDNEELCMDTVLDDCAFHSGSEEDTRSLTNGEQDDQIQESQLATSPTNST